MKIISCVTTMIAMGAVLRFMPDSPVDELLFKSEDRVTIIQAQYCNQMGIRSPTWRRAHLVESGFDSKTWLFSLAVMAATIPTTGLFAKAAIVLEAYGFDKLRLIQFFITVLLQPLYVLATALAVLVAVKRQTKGLVVLLLCAPPLLFLCCVILSPLTRTAFDLLLVPSLVLSSTFAAVGMYSEYPM